MILQGILSIVILLSLWRGAAALHKRQLSMYVSFAWVLLWMGALVIVLWPDLTSQLATVVGIGRGVDLVVYVSILTIFVILFKMLVHFDHIDERITKLAQHMALNEYERKEHAKKSSDSDPRV